jgi:hypothetical protein
MGKKSRYEAIPGAGSQKKPSKAEKLMRSLVRRGNRKTQASDEVAGMGVTPSSTEKFGMFAQEEKVKLNASAQSNYGTFTK